METSHTRLWRGHNIMATNRYKHSEIEKNTDGKRFYRSTIFPSIKERETDIFIYSRRGDRLDLLANRYYSDPTLWWIIAEANHLVKGTFAVEPSIRLRIPTNVTDILEDLKDINKSR